MPPPWRGRRGRQDESRVIEQGSGGFIEPPGPPETPENWFIMLERPRFGDARSGRNAGLFGFVSFEPNRPPAPPPDFGWYAPMAPPVPRRSKRDRTVRVSVHVPVEYCPGTILELDYGCSGELEAAD